MKTIQSRLLEVLGSAEQAHKAMGVFKEYLPPGIDMKSKWETDDNGGIYVRLGDNVDPAQVEFLNGFAIDQGYNLYRHEMEMLLKGIPIDLHNRQEWFNIGEEGNEYERIK